MNVIRCTLQINMLQTSHECENEHRTKRMDDNVKEWEDPLVLDKILYYLATDQIFIPNKYQESQMQEQYLEEWSVW